MPWTSRDDMAGLWEKLINLIWIYWNGMLRDYLQDFQQAFANALFKLVINLGTIFKNTEIKTLTVEIVIYGEKS